MPIAALPVDVLRGLVPIKLKAQELRSHLEHLGCDVEGYTTVSRYQCEVCGDVMETSSSEQVPALCDICSCDFRSEPEKIKPAGPQVVPRPPKLRGPRVVRVEKADIIRPPARRPTDGTEAGAGAGARKPERQREAVGGSGEDDRRGYWFTLLAKFAR